MNDLVQCLSAVYQTCAQVLGTLIGLQTTRVLTEEEHLLKDSCCRAMTAINRHIEKVYKTKEQE